MKHAEQEKFMYELFDKNRLHAKMAVILIQDELSMFDTPRITFWQEVEKELEKI
jgi:hypothetical protein